MEAPDVLIDPVAGTVMLRMVPYHLDRLHGPHPTGATKGPEGLPFPFLEGAESFDVVWRGGMRRGEIGPLGVYEEHTRTCEESWWSWHAYAETPFGWVSHPTPRFKLDRLVAVELSPLGSASVANFGAMEQWLRRELGRPSETSPRSGWRGRLIKLQSWFTFQPEMTWILPWGWVHLFYEMREGDAVMLIRWDDPC